MEDQKTIIDKIKAGLAKGTCKNCAEKCKRTIRRCQWFNPTVEFMEQVRDEALSGKGA